MGDLTLPATEAVRLLTDTDPAVLALSGTINLEDSEELKRLSRSLIAEGKDFAIDWSAAEYLSTSAIQVLVALIQGAGENGHSIQVVSGNQGVERYLELAGLAGCPRRRRGKGESN